MKTTKSKLKISEHQLQTQLKNYLTAKGWYVMRLNSGKYSVGEGVNKRMIIGQDAGTPDLMAFKKFKWNEINIKGVTDTLFIEVKTLQNPKPTLMQTVKMQELEKYGAKCLVIHSLEELEDEI